MKHWEESWNYEVQQSIFDELRGVSSGYETLCRMLDITSQTMILEGEIKALFHDFQIPLNFNFLCIFFVNY